jgi:hypothetical protein
MKHNNTSCVWNTNNSTDGQALCCHSHWSCDSTLLKFDVIVDQRNISSFDSVKNEGTYYSQLPVILDERLQSQTLVTLQITNIHVEDTLHILIRILTQTTPFREYELADLNPNRNLPEKKKTHLQTHIRFHMIFSIGSWL